MKEKIDVVEQEIKTLKKKNKKLINNQHIDNHGLQQNNIKNIKNKIIIRSYGEEDMSRITDFIMAKKLAMGFKAIERLVEEVHIGVGNECNCNLLLNNKGDEYMLVYDRDEWIL